MSAFECYKEYVALKNHFSKQSFDYFKYNGKVRANPQSFEKRKDKVFFQKLAKHSDLHNFLLANFSIDSKTWIKDLAYNKDAENNYKNWLKRQQSLSYLLKEDLSKLDENFDNNFVITDNSHPILFKKYLANEIGLETFCLLLEVTGAIKHWDEKLKYDIIWEEHRNKILKYTPFINYDRNKFKKIVLEYFSK